MARVLSCCFFLFLVGGGGQGGYPFFHGLEGAAKGTMARLVGSRILRNAILGMAEK